MSTILDPLVKRLRQTPFALWERLADEAGVAKSLPRKLVYGDRTNPRVQTIQPLFDYFADVDAGKRQLPDLSAEGMKGAPDHEQHQALGHVAQIDPQAPGEATHG